jgi:ferredoxin-thioredoxin reductase catalytic subunit
MAIAAVTTTIVATNSNDEKSLLAQNVEALASGEESHGRARCYSKYTKTESTSVLQCGTCVYVDGSGTDTGGYCKW